MSFETFTCAAPDSLYWYDLLPGDGFSVSVVPDTRPIENLRDELIFTKAPQVADIDKLAALLLGHNQMLEEPAKWKSLAQHMSRCMAEQLTSDGNRGLRMRAQRLNYYIEALIADNPSELDMQAVDGETPLKGMKPWDYIEHLGCTWWVSSGSPNIYRDNGSKQKHWTLGLPTQLDSLPDGRLVAGSIYSDGASIHDGRDWQKLVHDHPVPLIFQHDNTLYFLDHQGTLWRDEPREKVANVVCRQVHFARYFNGVVYCLDNSDYGQITTFNMESQLCKKHSVLPVQVCNDLTINGQFCYLIDKQQGSIFKFDLNFRFLEQRLQFGRNQTQLLDPVSIRINRDRLEVVSWLSQKLTQLHIF